MGQSGLTARPRLCVFDLRRNEFVGDVVFVNVADILRGFTANTVGSDKFNLVEPEVGVEVALYRLARPGCGQDTDTVLRELLSMSDDEIATLRAKKIIQFS
ncbi:MAG: hypothetical protein IPK59_05995 [Rhodospirillaceae bacterium]|nr:hypothetical protein [Rhodospirillaceae bacterium]